MNSKEIEEIFQEPYNQSSFIYEKTENSDNIALIKVPILRY